MNYGETQMRSVNASSLLFCELSYVKVLVLAGRLKIPGM
jgi:hypothetical protein